MPSRELPAARRNDPSGIPEPVVPLRSIVRPAATVVVLGSGAIVLDRGSQVSLAVATSMVPVLPAYPAMSPWPALFEVMVPLFVNATIALLASARPAAAAVGGVSVIFAIGGVEDAAAGGGCRRDSVP